MKIKETKALVLIAVIVLIFASCGDPDGNTVSVTGVTLNKAALTLTVGDEETLTAAVAPADATNKNVQWASSDAAVATVTDGKVKAVSAGTAKITVTTVDGSKTADCTVTVVAVVNINVTLNKTELILAVGKDETLVATVKPDDAANKNVTWESSDKAIATVADGKVTAVKDGTAKITVTTVDGGKTADCTVTVSKTFYAQNMADYKYYSLEAIRLAEGEHCNVWVDVASGVDKATAEKMAKAYDEKIHKQIIDVFSPKDFNDGDDTFADAIEFASALTESDGKLCILLLDIKDGYKKAGDPYTAGYFSSNDFWEGENSNYRPMIYIDTNPGVPGDDDSNTTLAHELQHLINYSITQLIRIEDATEFPMDIWIDEGLSAAAEWVYAKKHDDNKLDAYNKNWSGLINKGNNFYVWGNYDSNQYAILDDYATVYLFFQWLRIQAKTTDIYIDIITGTYDDGFGFYDSEAVINAASIIDADYDWETLLMDWLAANYINAPNSRYGYGDDAVLSKIKKYTVPKDTKTIKLSPGEGVYSIIPDNFDIPEVNYAETFIRYVSLNPDLTDPEISTDSTKDWVLLTFNVNNEYSDMYGDVVLTDSMEDGTTTGVALASVSIGRSLSPPGSFKLDARDMLKRNGNVGNNVKQGLKQQKRSR